MKKNNLFSKEFSWSNLFAVAIFILLFVYCISLLIPVFWMIWSSFKDVMNFYQDPFGLPDIWFPTNYPEAFKMLKIEAMKSGKKVIYDIWSMTGVSLFYSVGRALVGIFWPMMTAYVVSRYDFKGKHLIYVINLFVMTVPVVGTLPASLRIYRFLYISAFYYITESINAFACNTINSDNVRLTTKLRCNDIII